MSDAIQATDNVSETNLNIQACDFPALWASYINNADVEGVMALYNQHAVLMPTFSPHMVKTQVGLKDYFTQLSTREGLRVNLHKNSVNCVKIENQSYVICGLYSFEFLVDDILLNFPSRFTFVIDLAKEKPIMHHQSSQVPRTLN